MRRRATAAILVASLIVPFSAIARDCEYDDDCPRRWYCSDDAVCKRLRRQRREEGPEEIAESKLGGSTRRAYASIILGPATLALAVTAGIFAASRGDNDGLRTILVIYPLLFGTAAAVGSGATGGHGGIMASAGLEELGADAGGGALSISGWVLWGIGVAGYLVTITTMFINARDIFDGGNGSTSLAIGAFASGALSAAGGVMLGVDCLQRRNALETALEDRGQRDERDTKDGDEYDEEEEGSNAPTVVPAGLGIAVLF